MDKISASGHIGNMAADYVLDNLPAVQRSEIAKHISSCAHCRRLVSAEERIGLLVRSTIDAAGQNQAALNSLMPTGPSRKFGLLSSPLFSKQLAVAAVVMVVFLAGFNVVFKQDTSGYSAPLSTAYLATASYTHTPAAATLSPTPSLEAFSGGSSSEPVVEQLPEVSPAPAPIDAGN